MRKEREREITEAAKYNNHMYNNYKRKPQSLIKQKINIDMTRNLDNLLESPQNY